MVNAAQHALLTCDVPTRQYLLWLDKERVNQTGKQSDRFVIKPLEEPYLLVREDRVDWIMQQVKAFNNKNVYTAPTEQQ